MSDSDKGRRLRVNSTFAGEYAEHRGKWGTVTDYIEPNADTPVWCTNLDDGSHADLSRDEFQFEGEYLFRACGMESIYFAELWLVDEIERQGTPECGWVKLTVEYIKDGE